MSTKARAAALITAVLVFVAMLIWQTQEAYAVEDHRQTATAGEWSQLELGQTRGEVREILDWTGYPRKNKIGWWYPIENKHPDTHRLYVYFKNGKLKDAHWIVLRGAVFTYKKSL